MHHNLSQKSARIDIRTTALAKRTLQEAASMAQKTVSEFILDSALTQASEVLADRRRFLLDDDQWAAFMAALDAPTRPMPRLERLLNEPSILDARQ